MTANKLYALAIALSRSMDLHQDGDPYKHFARRTLTAIRNELNPFFELDPADRAAVEDIEIPGLNIPDIPVSPTIYDYVDYPVLREIIPTLQPPAVSSRNLIENFPAFIVD